MRSIEARIFVAPILLAVPRSEATVRTRAPRPRRLETVGEDTDHDPLQGVVTVHRPDPRRWRGRGRRLRRRRRAPAHRDRPWRRDRARRLGRGRRRLPDRDRASTPTASTTEAMNQTLEVTALAGSRPATGSTWSWRCRPRTGSAATSCRATSTASARSSRSVEDGFARRLRVGLAPRAAALRGRAGVDRPRRRQPHGRGAR